MAPTAAFQCGGHSPCPPLSAPGDHHGVGTSKPAYLFVLVFFHPKVGEKFSLRDEPGFSWKFMELIRRKVPDPWGDNGVGELVINIWVILLRVT